MIRGTTYLFRFRSIPSEHLIINKDYVPNAQDTVKGANDKFLEESSTNYFRDRKRNIHFILVCSTKTINSEEERSYIINFIKTLEQNGLQFELELGTVFKNLVFIKIHGPSETMIKYANAFDIPLAHKMKHYQIKPKLFFKCMATDLTIPDPDNPIVKRAWKTLEYPKTITFTERILIIYKLMLRAKYGTQTQQYGLNRLLKKKIFLSAYPLHDGQCEWTNTGSLTNRQLLAHYWANIKMWYKEQPLYIVEKYFGSGVALYFAFYDYYTKMLVFASAAGIFCFIIAFIISFSNTIPVNEICNSNQKLCPVLFRRGYWRYRLLNEICFYAKLTYLFDNSATILFAFFMSFWATSFMELWKRQHTVLLLRWNLTSEDTDRDVRKEYEENTKYTKISRTTGILEPYVPKRICFFNFAVTTVACLFMMIIVMIAVFHIILYRIYMIPILKMSNLASIKYNLTLIIMTTSSIINIIFIRIFGKFYGKLSLWLTTRENPRTQTEFDNSYIYKRFLLSFVNNYAGIIYVAFIMGKLYTHPGDTSMLNLSGIKADICHPSGCIVGLCIRLSFIMLLKSLAGNILTLCKINIAKWINTKFKHQSPNDAMMPPWERDYNLTDTNRYVLVGEYLEIVTQYGFVIFFAAAFPLAPLCVLINNLLEIRMDANKFVTLYKRPVPLRITGIKAWNTILRVMTLISTVTNAFVIAFTSDFVKREIYKYTVDASLKGYVNSTLSIFAVKDFTPTILHNAEINSTAECFYLGNRHPPNHPKKYQITSEYWFEFGMRFVTAAIFEHIILILTGVLAYALSDIPRSLKDQIKYNNQKIREEHIKATNASLEKEFAPSDEIFNLLNM